MSAAGDLERRQHCQDIRVDLSQDHKIRGMAIVFNKPSLDLGGFVEVIAPEAIDRTFREGLDVRALVDHDSSKILGRLKAGTLAMTKTTRGLQVVIDPPHTTVANDIMESMDRGDVTGMSFAFRVLQDTWNEASNPILRTVTDMRVSEVSIVTFPAYPATDVQVAQRSLQAFQAQRGGQSLDWWQRWHRTQLAR